MLSDSTLLATELIEDDAEVEEDETEEEGVPEVKMPVVELPYVEKILKKNNQKLFAKNK
jgi:hypothetical protein